MQNIKGSWHWEKVKHVYWTQGYYYPTIQWVTRSFSYPTIRFRWVPGYLLWGWIPIPGHFEPYIAWQRASIRVPTIVWRYHPGRKITYYTYTRVNDAPNVPIVHAAYYSPSNGTTTGGSQLVANHQVYSSWEDAPSTQMVQGKKLNMRNVYAHAFFVVWLPASFGVSLVPGLGGIAASMGMNVLSYLGIIDWEGMAQPAYY